MSDAAEKAVADLDRPERAAVETVRRQLETEPLPPRARSIPDTDPHTRTYAIDLLPHETGGRGITLVLRITDGLPAYLISWVIAGP
ncbi:hypothetical protein [Streptomyces omiyaensis]|uniref:hypothetical protein n=1 Tax=Streptomyces omiyaensis TaxID=68247 RepID=UPI001E3B93A1|nr:hypothetical protein [Streptomyces omiyaensis]